jgi:hypothetical protein
MSGSFRARVFRQGRSRAGPDFSGIRHKSAGTRETPDFPPDLRLPPSPPRRRPQP